MKNKTLFTPKETELERLVRLSLQYGSNKRKKKQSKNKQIKTVFVKDSLKPL